MKAWPLLLVGIGACAEPPRRPPVTYVPIVRSPETPPPPASLLASLPAEKEAPSSAPASASTPVSTAEAPSSDELCFKKTERGCCEDLPVKAKPNAKACPGGTVRKNKCKGFGRNCLPNPPNADGTRDKTPAR